MTEIVSWKTSLSQYGCEELCALTFPSITGIDRAVDLIWSLPELKRAPYESPDGVLLVVPIQVVEILKKQGLDFQIHCLNSPGEEMKPETQAILRRRYGI